MSTPLVSILVTLTKGASIPTPTGVASAGTSVVVTGPDGVAQAAVVLTGNETPTPWSFTTSVAPGNSTATASDMDTAGAILGTPITLAFTEAGTPPAFLPTTAITVTPVGGAGVAAAIKK